MVVRNPPIITAACNFKRSKTLHLELTQGTEAQHEKYCQTRTVTVDQNGPIKRNVYNFERSKTLHPQSNTAEEGEDWDPMLGVKCIAELGRWWCTKTDQS